MVLYVLIALAVLVTTGLITPTLGIVGTGYAWIETQGLVSIYALLTVMSRYRARRVQHGNSQRRQE